METFCWLKSTFKNKFLLFLKTWNLLCLCACILLKAFKIQYIYLCQVSSFITDSVMFKLLARHLCPAVLPLASLSSTSPSSPNHPARGDDVGGNGVGASVSNVASRASTRESPLTFGKVFTAIPRVTAITTPNINKRISQVWGLPALENSKEFKKIYATGRDELRSVQFVYKLQWTNLSAQLWRNDKFNPSILQIKALFILTRRVFASVRGCIFLLDCHCWCCSGLKAKSHLTS